MEDSNELERCRYLVAVAEPVQPCLCLFLDPVPVSVSGLGVVVVVVIGFVGDG
jgi:hypothetical protein